MRSNSREFSLSLQFLLLAFAISCLPVVHAFAQLSCTAETSKQAVTSLPEAGKSWQSLLEHQRSFQHCDDGELGAGYSEAITMLFAFQWDQFGRFAKIAERNSEFSRWAVRHIDSSASHEDLKRIVQNTTKCADSTAMQVLCSSIRKAASDALRELRVDPRPRPAAPAS